MKKTLSPELLELYQERAAILEFYGKLSRAEAEREAMRLVLALPPSLNRPCLCVLCQSRKEGKV